MQGEKMSQLENILSRLSGVRKQGGKYRCNCPNGIHEKVDNNHLMVSENSDGSVGIHCFAHCTATEVLYELELRLCDLYPPRTKEDRALWTEKIVVRAVAKAKDDAAVKLYTEICVIKEMLQNRIFKDEKHPTNKTELWAREKEAVRMLPKYFREYYS